MGEFLRGRGTVPAFPRFSYMIAITITPAAYKALKVMRPATDDASAGGDGMIRIWLEGTFFDELARMKSPGEYSKVILRLAKADP